MPQNFILSPVICVQLKPIFQGGIQPWLEGMKVLSLFLVVCSNGYSPVLVTYYTLFLFELI